MKHYDDLFASAQKTLSLRASPQTGAPQGGLSCPAPSPLPCMSLRTSPQTGVAIRTPTCGAIHLLAIRFPLHSLVFRDTQSFETFEMRISGLSLSICAARCLRKRKRLPSRCGRLTPPQAALPCGPCRFAPRNDSAGRNAVIKMCLLTKTECPLRGLSVSKKSFRHAFDQSKL